MSTAVRTVTGVAPLTDTLAVHGEGPVWDDRQGRLIWLDMLAGRVISTDPRSGDSSAAVVPSKVAAIARPFAAAEDWLLAGERTIFRTNSAFQTFERIADLPLGPGVRTNDGACDRTGRLYIGTMAYDERPGAGALYRVTADGDVDVAMTSVTVSNGLDFSEDDGSAYYIDSPEQSVVQLAFSESGAVASRRTAVDIPPGHGVPDGLTVDSEGGIWVALWDGGAVHRYGPDGALDMRIPMPVQRPTSCCFGGPDLAELYITTSRYGLGQEGGPAGALFRCRPGVTGRLPLPFGP